MNSAMEDPRAIESRDRLVDAGWALLNELTLADIFSALSVDSITRRAGRSERTFWNHFSDWQTYVDTLVSDIPRLRELGENEPWLPIEVVRETLRDAERGALPELIQQATTLNWDAIQRPEEVEGFLRQMLLLSRVPTEPGLGEVLARDYWGMHHEQYTEIYRVVGESLGVEPVPPIDWAGLARLLTALTEGTELVWMCGDQDASNPPNLPLAMSMLAVSLVRPVGSHDTFESRAAGLLARAGPALSDDELPLTASQCRDAIASYETEHGSLDDGRTDPSWPESLWRVLSEVTGVGEVRLRHQLQRPEVIGALAFSTRLPLEVHRRSHATDHPLLTRAADWICELVRVTRADRWCAHALISERLRAGADRQRITELVDPGAELALLLDAHPRVEHTRVVNTAMAAALSDDSGSPAVIASAVVRAIPGIEETTGS